MCCVVVACCISYFVAAVVVVFLLLLLRKALTVQSKLSWNYVTQADLRSSCLSLLITGITV